MKIDILTLFPSMFDGFISESIIKRAISAGKVSINIHDIREYSKDPHKKVDDYGYGGGEGMVLMPQPIFDAVRDLKTDDSYVFELDRDALEIIPYGVAGDLLKSDVSSNYGTIYSNRYKELIQSLDPRKGMHSMYFDGGFDI